MSSAKERVVFIDRAGFCRDELPIPEFDHTWSEFPFTLPDELVPRVFWSTILITHECPLPAELLGQLHKLQRVVITGAAVVDEAVCAARGVRVTRVEPGCTSANLVAHLEAEVRAAR